MANNTADQATPSLDIVGDEVERVIDEQRKRADSADTKCGLALAFAGAIMTLTREDTRLMVTGIEPPPVRWLPRLIWRIQQRICKD
jgi:hypothetical protein